MVVRVNIKKSFDAITPVISFLLVMGIAVSVTSAILIWGVPIMEELQSRNTWEDVEMQFNSVLDVIRDLANCEPGEQRIISVVANEGYISIDEDEYHRTIVIYSYDSNYDFTVSELELDDGDDLSFILNDPGGPVSKAEVHWLDEENPTIPPQEIPHGNPSSFPWTITAGNPIDGTIRIDLYDDDPTPEIVGKIWLFDSNDLGYTMPSSTGTYEMSIERSGIIYSGSENPEVKRVPKVTVGEESIAIGVIQTTALSSFLAGNGFNVWINVISDGVYVGEIYDVFNLRLQFDEGYAETWLNYFNVTKYEGDFEKEASGDTLLYKPSIPSVSSDGIWFTFSYSNIKIKFNN